MHPEDPPKTFRAAQYVRMSTEHQQYSTHNQADKIQEYADRRGIEIVRTYADEGKSGLSIDGRASLQKLIADVEAGNTDFNLILVYDVSRWGRFQDADESAYYEYICKRKGIAVAYVAEQFENDGSPVSSRHVGMIVLGGATQHSGVFLAHGQVPLGEAAERMSAPVGLVRQYPKLELMFSGGEGRLLATGTTEAELARAFYEEQAVDMARVTLEGGSRNTRENAHQVAKLLGPRCQQPWLLVTSAWHMPRSMAEFKAAGCKVTAYPVDFRTGDSTSLTEYSMAQSLLYWQTALHEWLGLLVYGVTR